MDFRFLTLEDVLELHTMQLEAYGGAAGVREQSLLESAIMVPQASFGGEFIHKDVFEMAAPMLFILLKTSLLLMGTKEQLWLLLWFFWIGIILKSVTPMKNFTML